MQTKNSILQHLKKSMTNRTRKPKQDKEDNNTPSRELLPRRCKTVQPFYAIDSLCDEEDVPNYRNTPVTKKKRTGLPSSSTTINTPQQPLTEKQQEKQKQKLKEKEEEEVKTISNNILSWLIEMKVVKENTVIKCIHGVRKDHIGYGAITRDGIGCYCCGEVFSVASFPRHRGDIFVDKPYENLFIEETKVSLLSCQIEAWNRHSVPARSGYHHVVRRPRVKDNSDDSCVICADGGDLICCDNCPSTYHLKCLGFKVI